MMITRETVEATVRAAVLRTPDAINPREGDSCLNTGPDGTYCIAAQAIVDLGFEPEFLEVGNTLEITSALGDAHLLGSFTEDAIDYLDYVQHRFDDDTTSGLTWAQSLERLEDQ